MGSYYAFFDVSCFTKLILICKNVIHKFKIKGFVGKLSTIHENLEIYGSYLSNTYLIVGKFGRGKFVRIIHDSPN